MYLRRIVFHALAVAVLVVSFVAVTNAQAQRTFVSVYGSDANATPALYCGNTNPCRTFSAAQTVTNVDGEIVALTSGGYGQITITKGLTLIGTGVSAALSTPLGGNAAITVAVDKLALGSRTVVLRDLRVQGLGKGKYGIDVQSVKTLYIQGTTVERFLDTGIYWESTTDGALIISDTTSRDNIKQSGLEVETVSETRVTIDHSRFVRNGDDGIALTGNNICASISDSIASENKDNGVNLGEDGTGAVVAITRTTASNNGSDGYHVWYGELNLEHCTASSNGNDGVGLVTSSGTCRVALSIVTNNKRYGFYNSGTGTFESLTGLGSMVQGNFAPTNGTITPIIQY